MNIYEFIKFCFISIPPKDKQEFHATLDTQNVMRGYPIAWMTLIIEGALLLRTIVSLLQGGDSQQLYARFTLYLVMALLMGTSILLMNAMRKHPNRYTKAPRIVSVGGSWVALLWAVGMTLIDVAGSYKHISVLIGMMYLMMVLFVLPPRTTLLILASMILIFCFSSFWLMQGDALWLGHTINVVLNGILAWVVAGIIYSAAYLQFTTNRMVQETNVQLQQLNQELQDMSSTDSLTSLMNRRMFDKASRLEWQRSSRDSGKIVVALADIDFFKQYNDTYGHQQGDTALIAVSHTLKAELRRASDIVARYGGEEFIILLACKETDHVDTLLPRIIACIEELQIPHVTSKTAPYLTISMGVCYATPTKANDLEEAIRQADLALYRAKAAGRNRYEVYDMDTHGPCVRK